MKKKRRLDKVVHLPPYIFQTEDDVGLRVVCSESQWEQHILTQHPELLRHEQTIKLAVEKAGIKGGVYRGNRASSYVYQMRFLGANWKQMFKLTTVVVDTRFEGADLDYGYVRTAYLAPKAQKPARLLRGKGKRKAT